MIRFVKKPASILIKRPTRALRTELRRRRSLSPARLTGKLAREGGMPVRDAKLRPWPTYPCESERDWKAVEPVLKRLFLEGREGIPQELSREFAERWASYLGARHALLVPHGTDALRIALAATLDHDGLDYGGEIIVPNLSFIASTNAALDRRFSVALVDVDPETLLIDPNRVEEAIIPGKTRAIMPVHLFGQMADMASIVDIAKRHDLKIIEDAAQAHGAIHELGRAGTIGDAAGFSFQSSKNLTAGEGGALTTNDPAIFERARAMCDVGRSQKNRQRWGHESLGWNIRPSEYTAAVLLHRLETLEAEQELRAANAAQLREELSQVSCVEPLGIGPGLIRDGVHMFVMRYRPEECGGLSIDDFVQRVKAEGIPLNHRLYNSITQAEQPVLRHLAEENPEFLRVLPTPVADRAARETLRLPHPLFLGTKSDMTEIAAAMAKVQAHSAPRSSWRLQPFRSGSSEDNGHSTAISGALQMPHITGSESPAQTLRIGIVGIGTMGRKHVAAIRRNHSLTLAGMTDVDIEAAGQAAEEFGCSRFDSFEHMIESGEIDVLVVATPHWQHPEPAIAALRAGLHVVCEKPLAVTVSQADRLIRAASESPGKFAVVFQHRFQPAYQFAKQLLDSGELGPIYRCELTESAWRPQAYYEERPWRGTWKGEGGGVLINQAPHVLDRYAWLCGPPESVTSRCETVLHQIETEDTASAIVRHANGAHGLIHVNTVEYRFSRLEIACDRGRLTIENGQVFLTKFQESIQHRTATATKIGGSMEAEKREISFPNLDGMTELLDLFYEDFVAAILEGKLLTCPGAEGIHAVELANAIILSSASRTPVTLPMDRDAYDSWIAEAIGQPQISTQVG